MRTATATAHANIALIKYWGKRDAKLNLPACSSLSITLAALSTSTRIVFDAAHTEDSLWLNGVKATTAATERVQLWLNAVREAVHELEYAHIFSEHNFPVGAGLASSASGFAALATATQLALKLPWDARTLSIWARRGSGSAARSIFGGFVEMHAGQAEDGSDAFATPFMAKESWPLHTIVAITSYEPKAIGSRTAMEHSRYQSPFYSAWLDSASSDLTEACAALRSQDFWRLAEVAEHSCMKMHALLLTHKPYLLYWNPATLTLVQCIQQMRQHERVPVFFTIDAGPQVKAICLPEASAYVQKRLSALPGVEHIMHSELGDGARISC
jgi:diphosphomevalonate decarboxylase